MRKPTRTAVALQAAIALIAVSVTPAVAASDCGQDPIYDRDQAATVTTGARIRSIACMEGSEVMSTLAVGAPVTIIAETDGWYKVRTASGLEGWVGQWLLSASTGGTAATPAPAAVTTVPLPASGLVKSPDMPAVYLVSGGARYAFPDDKTFSDWYTDWSGVETVSAADLATLRLAGNVRHRPGRTLVKIKTDPKVYAVSRYGVLRWIQSEEAAKAIFGERWQDRVRDVEDIQFTDYSLGAPIASSVDFSPESEEAGQTDASDDIRPEGYGSTDGQDSTSNED